MRRRLPRCILTHCEKSSGIRLIRSRNSCRLWGIECMSFVRCESDRITAFGKIAFVNFASARYRRDRRDKSGIHRKERYYAITISIEKNLNICKNRRLRPLYLAFLAKPGFCKRRSLLFHFLRELYFSISGTTLFPGSCSQKPPASRTASEAITPDVLFSSSSRSSRRSARAAMPPTYRRRPSCSRHLRFRGRGPRLQRRLRSKDGSGSPRGHSRFALHSADPFRGSSSP